MTGPEIKEIKTVNDTMGERLEKLGNIIGYEQNKLDVKDIALRKAVNCFHEALQPERDYISISARDMMQQFVELRLERLMSTGVGVPVFEEQVDTRRYIMFINFYETEDGMDLNMDLKKFDAEEMVTYKYNTDNGSWVVVKTAEDVRRDAKEKNKTARTTIDLLVEAGNKGDMSEQALHSFLYSDHDSIYGSDIYAFSESVKPLVYLMNRLAGIVKLEILKNGQPAVVPMDGHHKGIAITLEKGGYVINHYYADDMLLEDGTVAEKDKYFYINPVYRTKDMESAAEDMLNAVNARTGLMYPVTLTLSRGVILTIRESNVVKMIASVNEKLEDLERNKKITDTEMQMVTKFVEAIHCFR